MQKHIKKTRIKKMKVRNGFVSNSSSSSFCIFGVVVNDKILEIVKKKVKAEAQTETEEYMVCEKCGHTPRSSPKFCEKCGGNIVTKTREVEYEYEMYEMFEAVGLAYNSDDYTSYAGVGISGCDVEAIISAQKELEEIFGSEMKFKVYSGESY